MQEAVSNAVLQMGDDKTTVLHEDVSASQNAAGAPSNPLALMLNYGDDEDDDEEEEEEDAAGGMAQVEGQQMPSAKAPSASTDATSSSHSDDPLASFLNELNDEGLLDDQVAKSGMIFPLPVPSKSPSPSLTAGCTLQKALLDRR